MNSQIIIFTTNNSDTGANLSTEIKDITIYFRSYLSYINHQFCHFGDFYVCSVSTMAMEFSECLPQLTFADITKIMLT